jgi:iron(III) transport system substrate-binding protein
MDSFVPARLRRAQLSRGLTLLMAGLLLAACTTVSGGASPDGGTTVATASVTPSGTLRLYSSVTQDTIDAVVAAYNRANPGVSIEVFRAPTGQLDGRIAGELRSGGVSADLLWATDPLSVQAYAARGLFAAWTPAEATSVPEQDRADTFWGTRLLNLVIVHAPGMANPPTDWRDLTDSALAGKVAIPDPGFAGSAFGALGYFASTDGYGMAYYRALKANGAVQVQSVTDTLNGVAEGQFLAGITLDKSARDAIAAGSPVEMTWPASGAIAIYSPIAVWKDAANPVAARSFVDFVLSPAGQAAIASTGWQPIRSGVDGAPSAAGAQVSPDWAALFDHQDQLLSDYRSVFGG